MLRGAVGGVGVAEAAAPERARSRGARQTERQRQTERETGRQAGWRRGAYSVKTQGNREMKGAGAL